MREDLDVTRDMPHVAIGGRMQVGKTTCALRLVETREYELRSLAHPIKALARDGFGWDGAKDARGRRLLQGIGTVGRAYDPGVWLRSFEAWLASRPGGGPVVVDDVRLVAEADRLRELGFRIVLVRRPSVEDAASPALRAHETETELDALDPDLVLVNDGSLEELLSAVDSAFSAVAPR